MTSQTTTEEARRVVLSLFEHWITDPDKVEPLLHDDFKLWHRADPRHTPRAAGPMDKAQYMAGLRIVQDVMTYDGGTPGMKITIVSVTAEDNRVVVEIEAEAVSSARPDYTIHNHGIGVYEVEDGQIISERGYEDTAMLNFLFSSGETTAPGVYDDPFLDRKQ